MDAEKLANEIAARLRAERARLNLTLRDVEGRSGVSFVSIGRFEQAKRLPTMEALYRLAEAYGVEPTVLLPPLASVADLPKGRGKK